MKNWTIETLVWIMDTLDWFMDYSRTFFHWFFIISCLAMIIIGGFVGFNFYLTIFLFIVAIGNMWGLRKWKRRKAT